MKKRSKLAFINKYLFIFVLIILFIAVRYTYSYLAYKYKNTSVIKGNVISVNLEMTVDLVVGNNRGMVPLKDSSLGRAINGTGGKSACVDANGNLSCQVYKITLNNKGSKVKNLMGTISLYNKDSSSTFSNLKWRELASQTEVIDGSEIHGMDTSTLMKGLTMASGETKVYYIAVYIQETGSDQKNLDKGNFAGRVTVTTDSTGLALNLGDYVAITPIKSSYTTDTSKTGSNESQTINPQELNLWRVIKIYDDNSIDVISEYKSSTNIGIRGRTGYLNLVGYLNVIASQYENSDYTIASRCFGYSNQVEYLDDVLFTSPPPWLCNTGATCSPETYENVGGGDLLYKNDYYLVKNALGTVGCKSVDDSNSSDYWMASRFYNYDSSNNGNYYYFGRNTRIIDSTVGTSIHASFNGGKFDNTAYNSFRPILTLKSDLKYSGMGTSSNPFKPSTN